jgi:ribonuclease HII
MTRRIHPPGIEFEHAYWNADVEWVAGVDEAGRGAWAGPVVAGAVLLPRLSEIPASLRGIHDSKLLTPALREKLFDIIIEAALSYAVGLAPAEAIDRMGILPATRAAMYAALEALSPAPQAALIDAVRLPALRYPQQAIIKGDQKSLSIAAASIVAKVSRDRWMRECEAQYPGYGFSRHKGYGTLQHRAALDACGPCAIHRRSFAPLRQLRLCVESDDE